MLGKYIYSLLKKDYKYITNYDITVIDVIGLHYYEIIGKYIYRLVFKGRGHFAAYGQSKFYVWSLIGFRLIPSVVYIYSCMSLNTKS